MQNVTINLNPISTSFVIFAIMTILLGLIGLVGLKIVNGMKAEQDESGVYFLRGLYIACFGLIMCICCLSLTCQSPGCTESGSYKLQDQTQKIQALTEQNEFLQTKLKVLTENK